MYFLHSLHLWLLIATPYEIVQYCSVIIMELELIQTATSIMGDVYDPYTGEVSFKNTDILINTNSGMPIEIKSSTLIQMAALIIIFLIFIKYYFANSSIVLKMYFKAFSWLEGTLITISV